MEENNKATNFWKVAIAVIITGCLVFIGTSAYYLKKLSGIEPSVIYGSNSYAKLDKVKEIIEQNFLFDYDEDKLIDGAISGMLETLDDPYTVYYTEDEWTKFMTETEGEYDGVGLYITYDTTNSTVIVLTPIENSPAAEAGILPGDYIISIDGESAVGKSLDEVASLLKGRAGTSVKVEFERIKDKESEKFERTLVRGNIVLDPVVEKVYEGNIGYIKLTSFDETTYKAFKNSYDHLIKDEKVSGLILDLRNNPGGLLDVSTKIADLLVPEGKIVYTVDKNGKEEAIFSDDNKIEIPMAVLINEGSASASEVLTAAIKDYGVGVIVGTKSYGKGIVQGIKTLRDGTYMKITISEYFSPKGEKINKIGITPDIEVELPEDVTSLYNLSADKDTQLQRAIEELKKMM
ncbi:MAG: S41 family peptidase [Clostridia bacterium]|nr:S41 family peptidase [Clostridia bacterium]